MWRWGIYGCFISAPTIIQAGSVCEKFCHSSTEQNTIGCPTWGLLSKGGKSRKRAPLEVARVHLCRRRAHTLCQDVMGNVTPKTEDQPVPCAPAQFRDRLQTGRWNSLLQTCQFCSWGTSVSDPSVHPWHPANPGLVGNPLTPWLPQPRAHKEHQGCHAANPEVFCQFFFGKKKNVHTLRIFMQFSFPIKSLFMNETWVSSVFLALSNTDKFSRHFDNISFAKLLDYINPSQPSDRQSQDWSFYTFCILRLF